MLVIAFWEKPKGVSMYFELARGAQYRTANVPFSFRNLIRFGRANASPAAGKPSRAASLI
jgi:hypothetical protein